MQGRRLVFISHANPEDNEFVSWLGTRLTVAGYEVWADVLKLSGGEAFGKILVMRLSKKPPLLSLPYLVHPIKKRCSE